MNQLAVCICIHLSCVLWTDSLVHAYTLYMVIECNTVYTSRSVRRFVLEMQQTETPAVFLNLSFDELQFEFSPRGGASASWVVRPLHSSQADMLQLHYLLSVAAACVTMTLFGLCVSNPCLSVLKIR